MRKTIVRDSNNMVVHTIRYSEPPQMLLMLCSTHDRHVVYCSNALFSAGGDTRGSLGVSGDWQKVPHK